MEKSSQNPNSRLIVITHYINSDQLNELELISKKNNKTIKDEKSHYKRLWKEEVDLNRKMMHFSK